MKQRLINPIVLLLILLPALSFAASATGLPDFIALAKQLKPAVVNISTTKITPQRQPNSPGSPDDFFTYFRTGRKNRANSRPWARVSSFRRTAIF